MAANALDDSENNPGRLPCPQAWGDVGTERRPRRRQLRRHCRRLAAVANPRNAEAASTPRATSSGTSSRRAGTCRTAARTSPSTPIPPGQLSSTGDRHRADHRAGPGAPHRAERQPDRGRLYRAYPVASPQIPRTAPNPLDFLDCQNGSTADNTFATVVDNDNPVFNDQVLAVTDRRHPARARGGDCQAHRARDRAGAEKRLRGADLGNCRREPVSRSRPSSPSGPAGSSTYLGDCAPAPATTRVCCPSIRRKAALEPCGRTSHCFSATPGVISTSPGVLDVRPDAQIAVRSGSIRTQSTCACRLRRACTTSTTPTDSVRVRVNVTNNVAMGLRDVRPDEGHLHCGATTLGAWNRQTVLPCAPCRPSVQRRRDHSCTLARSPTSSAGWGTYANYTHQLRARGDRRPPAARFRQRRDRLVRAQRVVPTAVLCTAPGHTAAILPAAPHLHGRHQPACTVTNLTPASKQRAILILAGRSLGGVARPSTLADFVERGANLPADRRFRAREAALGSSTTASWCRRQSLMRARATGFRWSSSP